MTTLELVQGQLDAYNQQDFERFCLFYHFDACVRSLLEDQILISGMNEFKNKYNQLFQKNPSQRCLLMSRIILENSIIDEELIEGRTGHPWGLKAVAMYSFLDGLIHRIWFV